MSYANLQTNLLSILGVAEDTFDLVNNYYTEKNRKMKYLKCILEDMMTLL